MVRSRSGKRGGSSSSRWGMPAALGCIVLLALLLLFNLGRLSGGNLDGREEASTAEAEDGSEHALPDHSSIKANNGITKNLVGDPSSEAIVEQHAIAQGIAAQKPEVRSVESASGAFLQKKVEMVEKYEWKLHQGRSCQGYANGDSTTRSLESSKTQCDLNEACVAIECEGGSSNFCSLRAVANLVPFPGSDCYEKHYPEEADGSKLSSRLHPEYNRIVDQHYCYQPVTTQTGQRVNIILVRAPFRSSSDRAVFDKYKDDILFMGISSFEDYPLDAMNPFSMRLNEKEFLGIFPGFLHMLREPEKHFPPHVKTILMSQSDFQLPDAPARDYNVPRKYDFTLSGSDQDVGNDCVGWSSYAKNWSFVKEALVVMCGEYNLKGVLVATKNKAGTQACTIPDSCKGKMLQTTFLDQDKYFHYLKQSRFAFLPQVHDASPRVSTQALSQDVPLLMNAHISGGWKYLNEKTGEFFHDMTDFRQSLEKIIKNADIQNRYEPRKYVLDNFGNINSGRRLLKFVREHFSDRVKLPRGTSLLLT